MSRIAVSDRCLALLFALAVGATVPNVAAGQSAHPDSLEQWIRRGYVLGTPEARAVWRELGWSGAGFGFRSFAAREGSTGEAATESIQGFGRSMEYYRIRLDELHTRVEGDIGLAWGVHTEMFRLRGQPAESVRVRFSNTLRWDGQTWKNLLFHRDAQTFDANGRYVRTPH